MIPAIRQRPLKLALVHKQLTDLHAIDGHNRNPLQVAAEQSRIRLNIAGLEVEGDPCPEALNHRQRIVTEVAASTAVQSDRAHSRCAPVA